MVLSTRLWHLLTWLPLMSAAQQTFPTTVEVDLVFPRNETYAPTPLMPLVFAIRNSKVASSLISQFAWYIYRLDYYDGTIDSDSISLPYPSVSYHDPFVTFRLLENITVSEGVWAIAWHVGYYNCSEPSIPGVLSLNIRGQGTPINGLLFTLKNGAPVADLAVTSTDSCANNSQSFTYNVTDVLKGPYSFEKVGYDSCIVLEGNLPTPSASPCALKLDPSAVSSISSAITSSQCATPIHLLTSCPPRVTSEGNMRAFSDGSLFRHGWLIAASASLIFKWPFRVYLNGK